MISVVTTLYRTPAPVLARTWASLRAQTHTDWEWVVLDDSPDGESDAWRQVYGYCADDRYRITLLRGVHDGRIGAVKRRAFMAAAGSILVELDHDDELTPDALERIADAFAAHPDAGFVYSDWCEINAAGQSCRYPEGWAFGYGADRWDAEHGVWVMCAPPINDDTIRHIVSAPNHVRAWRADVYRGLGGHSDLDVADDYELVVRTFLATRFVHVPALLYRQHIGGHTAQRQRNDRIQQLVATIAADHATAITDRLAALGGGNVQTDA